jgi:hypothetical protein
VLHSLQTLSAIYKTREKPVEMIGSARVFAQPGRSSMADEEGFL